MNILNQRSVLQQRYAQLQRWLPSCRRQAPMFDTRQVADGRFISSVTITLTPDGRALSVSGSFALRKTIAEATAAATMLEQLENMTKGVTSITRIMLVDLDNVDFSPRDVADNPHCYFVIFASRNGTKSTSCYDDMANARVVITKALGRDAADIQMIFDAKSILSEFASCDQFGIATRDHFAIILSTLMSASRSTTMLCNPREVREFLRK